MERTPCSDKNRLKKGKWSPDEDKKLIDYVTRYGHWNWSLLPKLAGLARCGKSCRLRWLNYLRPNLKKGNYTQEEEETIIKLHQRLGNKWSAIAVELPGRTDNGIKNYWHSKLKKRIQHNSLTQALVSKSKDQSSLEPTANNNILSPFQSLRFQATTEFADFIPFSQHSPSSEPSSISTEHKHTTVTTSNENLVREDEFAFLEAYTFSVEGDFWLEPYMLDLSDFTSVPESISPVFDTELWSHDN